MRILGVVLCVVAGGSAVFFGFAPDNRVAAVNAFFNRLTGNPAQMCLDFYRQELEYPSTSRLLNEVVVGKEISVSYQFVDARGGNSVAKSECVLVGGKVDLTSTRLANDVYEIIELRLSLTRLLPPFHLTDNVIPSDAVYINGMRRASKLAELLISLLNGVAISLAESGESNLFSVVERRLALRLEDDDMWQDKGLLEFIDEEINRASQELEAIDAKYAAVKDFWGLQ